MITVFKGRKAALGATVGLALCASLAFVGNANAANAWWQLNASTVPANLPPGGSGKVILTATNLGDAEAAGSQTPVVLRGELPSGVTAASVTGRIDTLAGLIGLHGSVACSLVSPSVVECTYEGVLPPYEQIEVAIAVQVDANAKSGEAVKAIITGGRSYACEEVAFMSGEYTNSVCSSQGSGSFEKRLSSKSLTPATISAPVRISGAPVQFGTEDYELKAYNKDGSLDTQAGSHPFDLTTTLMLNRTGTSPYQPALPKDLQFKLPPDSSEIRRLFHNVPTLTFSDSTRFITGVPVRRRSAWRSSRSLNRTISAQSLAR